MADIIAWLMAGLILATLPIVFWELIFLSRVSAYSSFAVWINVHYPFPWDLIIVLAVYFLTTGLYSVVVSKVWNDGIFVLRLGSLFGLILLIVAPLSLQLLHSPNERVFIFGFMYPGSYVSALCGVTGLLVTIKKHQVECGQGKGKGLGRLVSSLLSHERMVVPMLSLLSLTGWLLSLSLYDPLALTRYRYYDRELTPFIFLIQHFSTFPIVLSITEIVKQHLQAKGEGLARARNV